MPWTFVLLGLAIVAVWLPAIAWRQRRPLPAWVPVYLGAVALGYASGVLDARALAALAVFAAVVWGSVRAPQPALRALLMGLAVLAALALAGRAVPGFRDPGAPGEGPRVFLNFGMGSAGLFMLAAYARRITDTQELRTVWRRAALAVGATVVGVFALAWAAGLVRLEPAWHTLTPFILAANLLFICVTEEALFRGLLQERLAAALQRWPAWRWLPVLVCSVLFGLAHAGKGPIMVGLATLAGLGYGTAYALTRRIEVPIAAHFGVNAVKHLGFVYTW